MNAPAPVKRNLWPMLGVAVLTLLIISPFDALPEAVLGPLGLLDDLGYGILDIALLLYIRHQKQQGSRLPGQAPLDPKKKLD